MVSGIQTLKKISHKARSLVKKRQVEDEDEDDFYGFYLTIIIAAIAGAVSLGYISINDIKKNIKEIQNTLKSGGKDLIQEQIKAGLEDKYNNLTQDEKDALENLTQKEKDAIKEQLNWIYNLYF